MRSIAILLGVVVAAMLGVASVAGAAPSLVTNAYPLAGEQSDLALVGSATLVATPDGPDTNVVRSFVPGEAPKVIAAVSLHPGSPESFSDSMSFSASATRMFLLDVGVSSGKYLGEDYSEQIDSGPLGGPLSTQSAGCLLTPSLDETVSDEDGGIRAHSAIAGDGEVLAYDSYGCLVARDFASGLQRIIPLDATLDPVEGRYIERLPEAALLRVAGGLLAYRANPAGGEGPSSIVVYEIATGRELYRVPLPAEDHPEGGFDDEAPTFGLQADGTLVIAEPSSCVASVSTIAEPAPHPLGIPACYIHQVADGRVLLVAPGPREQRLLEWTSIEAPAAHPIAGLGRQGILETAAPEMNETDVAYVLGGCYPRVYRTSLAEPGAPPILPTSCPIKASVPHATLTSRALRVSLLCPLGCRGRFTAWVGTAKQLRTGRGGEYLGSEPYTGSPARTSYSLTPGHPTTLTLPQTEEYGSQPAVRVLARRLRRDPHLKLVLTCETYTPSVEGLSEERAKELGIAFERFTTISIPIVVR